MVHRIIDMSLHARFKSVKKIQSCGFRGVAVVVGIRVPRFPFWSFFRISSRYEKTNRWYCRYWRVFCKMNYRSLFRSHQPLLLHIQYTLPSLHTRWRAPELLLREKSTVTLNFDPNLAISPWINPGTRISGCSVLGSFVPWLRGRFEQTLGGLQEKNKSG